MVNVSVFGGVKIIVPPGLSVSLSVLSLLGGREVKVSAQKEAPAASERTLRLNAFAILGGVEVVERPVGQE